MHHDDHIQDDKDGFSFITENHVANDGDVANELVESEERLLSEMMMKDLEENFVFGVDDHAFRFSAANVKENEQEVLRQQYPSILSKEKKKSSSSSSLKYVP